MPAIAGQPASQTVECGGGAVFSVSATGDGPLSHQWYSGSASIGGATDSVLALGGVSFASAGSYAVVVSNAGGSVTSSVVTLTVVDTTPVKLTIALMETNVVISWPQTCRLFTLQQTLALTETSGNWAPVSGQPVSVDGHLQLVIPAALSNVFYRLQSP